MSTAQTSDQSASPLIFAAPYLLGVVVQLPLLIRYMTDLASRPHYGLYLIGILATIGIAAIQWPWGQSNIHRATIKSVLFAVLAGAAGVAGGILSAPWFTACSVVLLIASYLSATVHREGLHSVGYAVLPLVAFIRPPLNLDLGINARLQEYAFELSGRFLSFLGAQLIHVRTDSAFEFPGKETILHLDSMIGIGSVFSLIFVALVCVAVGRKNLFQTVLLVLSCFLWAVLLNTVYLMLLPLLNYFLEIEIATGSVNHNMIRVFLLLGTALIVFSTAEFFNFAFGPVNPEESRSYEFGRFITAVWNSLLAGRPFINETGQAVGRPASRITIQPATMIVRWCMAGILLVASVLPLVSTSSFASVSRSDIVTLASDDMPESIDDWAAIKSKFRSHALLGTGIEGFEKETWVYQSPDATAYGSIAEPFSMWSELPKVYNLQGWATNQRLVVTPADPSDPWQYVMTDMSFETGEKQRVMFCYFDAAGQPVTPPASDSIGGKLSASKTNALAPLFQVSLTHSRFREMTPETDAALADLFLKFRQFARDRVLRGSTGANPDAAVAEPNPNGSTPAAAAPVEPNPNTDQSVVPSADTPAYQPSNNDFR